VVQFSAGFTSDNDKLCLLSLWMLYKPMAVPKTPLMRLQMNLLSQLWIWKLTGAWWKAVLAGCSVRVLQVSEDKIQFL
jgi:hypothetical protein